MSRSCDELGVCQQRKPRCAGCSAEPLRLAPGVLDGYRIGLFGTPAQRRELVRFCKIGIGMGLGLVVVALIAGLASGRFIP